MKRIALVLALGLLTTGCVSAKMFRTGSGLAYAPTKPDTVLVYFKAEDVPHPYEVIAEILLTGSSGWGKDDGDLVNKAQDKAAAIGAQAIIVAKEKDGSAVAAALLGTRDKVQHVKAIRFKE